MSVKFRCYLYHGNIIMAIMWGNINRRIFTFFHWAVIKINDKLVFFPVHFFWTRQFYIIIWTKILTLKMNYKNFKSFFLLTFTYIHKYISLHLHLLQCLLFQTLVSITLFYDCYFLHQFHENCRQENRIKEFILNYEHVLLSNPYSFAS